MSNSRQFSLFVALILATGIAACAAPAPTPPPSLATPSGLSAATAALATPTGPAATTAPATLPPAATPTPATLPPAATTAPATLPPAATTAPATLPPAATTAPATLPPAATAAATVTSQKEVTATLTWLGHSTFVLKTSSGLTALLDPMGTNMGYALKPVEGVAVVSISHEHSDHNNAALATGTPLVLRGLAGNDWAPIAQEIKGVRIYTVPTYHDDTQGSARGKNAVFVYDLGGLRIVHLGDLGHKLSDEQVKTIGAVDVLMIPVGGFFTIDGQGAAQVTGQLKPRLVIPMHYATPDLAAATAARLTNAEPFIAALGAPLRTTTGGASLTISSLKLPETLTAVTLGYK